MINHFGLTAGIDLDKYNHSQVIQYQGVKGLEQVTQNSTQAVDTLRVFEVANMAAFLDYATCERIRSEFVRQKLKHSLQLTNLKQVPAWTDVSEFVDIWECRYVDPAEIKTQVEMLIYNDVVAMYQYQSQNIFCLEIHNQDLANTLKQFYDFVWNRAQRMQTTNSHGAAKV